VICASCSRELPAGFPGAVVTCVCGAQTMLPAEERASRPSGGPYRVSQTTSALDREMRCTFCGNVCPSTVRVCPHCDVRFDSVRCARCYTLQAPGAFSCARCGAALELEPLLDATDAPCPRCNVPLEAAGGAGGWEDARVHECARCGGIFVPREALAELLCRAELSGPFQSPKRAIVVGLDAVRYVRCPLCHTSMNRVNFGKVSGVIVDVCRAHGTWFDAEELTRVIAFAASGGLARTRAREEAERKEATHAHVPVVVYDPRGEERLHQWENFLRDLLFW
jgi:Zn-finger nucleic acid-binding protein